MAELQRGTYVITRRHKFQLASTGVNADNHPVSIGQALRQEIERRGISHREAAEQIGVRQQSLSKWVTEINRPGPEHLPALARFLHQPIAEVREMRANGAPRLEDRMTAIEDELAELRKAITRLLAGQQ